MRRTVVFILSTNYAGSHLLSLHLGSHSQCLHIGEVRHLRRPGRAHRNACSLCPPEDSCVLFRGLSDVRRLHDVVFANAEPGVRVLVDTSKRVDWAERFLDRPDYSAKVIHLLRDPRALARRWELDYGDDAARVRHARWTTLRRAPHLGVRALFGPRVALWTARWLQKNEAITRFCRRRALDHRVVTYLDLARDPAGALRPLMEWIGLPFEAAQLAYWEHAHHGSRKADYGWVRDASHRHVDLRWQRDLDASSRAFIEGDRRIADYLRRLGLVMTDEGLEAAVGRTLGDRA